MTYPTLASYTKDSSVEDRLELVESVFSLHEVPDLSEVCLIGAQHILPTTLKMLMSFFDRGLLPEDVYLIGKCYSTDLYTYHHLKEIGVHVCPTSLQFKKNLPFDHYYRKNIENFVNNFLSIKKSTNKRLICIDDGGELITHLNHVFKRNKLKLAGLEQTTSGYQKIKNLNLGMGVVNVARSFAKINIESKIVIKTAIQALCDKLNKNSISPKNTLIFGNGAIGGAMADALEGNSNVFLADTNRSKSTGIYEDYLNNLSNFDLIIGCVGETVLPLDKINQLKRGTTIISLSSSDREFDIVKPRQSCRHLESCHDDFECANGVKVLNCGFPINFSGEAAKVDIEEFELTRALLALGALQACNLKTEKGLIPLNEAVQTKLIEKFSSKYSSQVKKAQTFRKMGLCKSGQNM
ncbi:MAG: hypothetical protein Tsb0015_14960 [Simkaniaceae bacterium]